MPTEKSPAKKAAVVRECLARDSRETFFVNLAGDYGYLELPYYVSQDLENSGHIVRPTCQEMLDAYITPIMLAKAKVLGVPTPDYYITNGYFEAPVIIDTANPFMLRSRIVLKQTLQSRVAKSMTRNYTYAICCQELPANSQVKYFRSVYGWCQYERFRRVSEEVWAKFGIPLAKVRVVILEDGRMLLSDIGPLPFKALNQHELDHLNKRVQWEE